jgi:hypothetical protein
MSEFTLSMAETAQHHKDMAKAHQMMSEKTSSELARQQLETDMMQAQQLPKVGQGA